MKDKIVLVTGATDGIGRHAAMEIAQQGATVLIHGRSPSRAKAVLEHMRKMSDNEHLDTFVADFASLKDVRRMAEGVRRRYPRLDVLVNNAGTYLRERQTTEDGFEMTLGVNHLAPFLLTNLLLDLLRKSSSSRVINISSVAHQRARLDLKSFQEVARYDAYDAYASSKLANLLFTYELAKRLKDSPVTVNALHPGVIATKLLQAGFGSFGGRSVEEGAKTIVYLATSEEIEGVTGKYFIDNREHTSSAESQNAKLQKDLWALSERLTGLIPE